MNEEGDKVSNSSDNIYFFDLSENTTYESRDIQVRQTDKAKNIATGYINGTVVIGNITPEYQSIEGNNDTITLSFSEGLYIL